MRSILLPILVVAFCASNYACSTSRLNMVSRAMEPTIQSGDRISIDENAYNSRRPERYDIIVFRYVEKTSPVPIQQPPAGAEICYRIVALPGESVEILPGGLLINGAPLDPPDGVSYSPAPNSAEYRRFNSLKLPADGYYLLGDNTKKALDSRYWGFIRENQILGKVLTD